MQQSDLLPHNGTPTSVAAAKTKRGSGTAEKDRARLYSLILHAPDGLTRKELERITGMSGDSLRPRLWELAGKGTKPVYPRPLIRNHETLRREGCAVLVVA